MVRPERIELPTSWFVAKHSIQLSYGRIREIVSLNYSGNRIVSLNPNHRENCPKSLLTNLDLPFVRMRPNAALGYGN
jgi:hypothetical protein